MMKRKLLVSVALWWLSLSLNTVLAIAAPVEMEPVAGEEVQILDEVVIGATKTERQRSIIPASVSVITKHEIAASPVRNLDEILRQQAGVEITRSQGIAIGIPERVDVRGVPGPNRTLVVVDGFPLNGSGTGFVTLQQIPLDTIERVEIIRGPYSCLYGANALGGIINIITKKGQGRPDISVIGGVGNNSWYQAGIQSGGGNQKAQYFVYGDNRSTDNYYFSNSEVQQKFDARTNQSYLVEVPSFNRSYEDWRYVGNFSFSPADNTSVTVSTRYFKNDTGLGLTNYLTANRDQRDSGEIFFGGLTLNAAPSDEVKLVLRAYARQFTDDLWNETSFLKTIFIPFPPPGRQITIPGFGPGYFRAVYQDYYVEGQTNILLGNYHTLTGGFDFLGVNAQFNPVVNSDTADLFPGSAAATNSITTAGFYLQDEIHVGNFNIIPGVRLDKHSLFDPVVSPKLGISYQLWENTVLRTSAGRAYRAPSVTELFRPEWNLNPYIRLRANPNLKPEYIWSVDGGIEHRFTPNLRVSVDGFYNNMKDFITTPALAGSPGIIQYQNLGKSWSTGLETAIEWRVLKWLSFFGNYTFLSSLDEQTNQPITTLPDHKINVGMRCNKKLQDWNVYGSAIETFVGNRTAQPLGTNTFLTQPTFALTDLALYTTYKEVATIGVTVQNLFDRKYQEAYGYLGPGRLVTFYAGLRGKF